MDLCLSCKGCKSECPSNVDVAKLKAEFLQHYYDANGVPFRSKLIANFTASAKLGALVPGLYNFAVTNKFIGGAIKKLSGFAIQRSMPTMYKTTLQKWFEGRERSIIPEKTGTGNHHPIATGPTINFFCDEFTNYNDTEIGMKAILLLEKLGYQVRIPTHAESGRTWLSKGLVRRAKAIINKNIELLHPVVSAETPMIGIEPSAILTFRDEYIDLATEENFAKAKALSKNVFYIDEFIAREFAAGKIDASLFSAAPKKIRLHGHCQQKALSALSDTAAILSIPKNYSVETIPSGCCGMAGSFGYEKEHYDLSMQIGELVLFPAVRTATADTIIAAPGTSCRHQIKDGTGARAKHPVEILWEALNN
jgi:Fe-S oxidoreductase